MLGSLLTRIPTRWRAPLIGVAVVAAFLLLGRLFGSHGGQPVGPVIKQAADSGKAAVVRAETVLVAQQARVDTITRLVAGAPNAAAERRASEALSMAQASESNAVRLRLQYDVMLAHKDSVIEDQAEVIYTIGALAARMTRANAEVRAELAAAKANLTTIALAPKSAAPCGVYCTTGKVVLWGGSAYLGAKYVQKYGVALPH